MEHVHICKNPLVQERLARMRDVNTSRFGFRRALKECGALISYEIASTFPTVNEKVESPLETAQVSRLNCQITVVGILRAALSFIDGLTEFLPRARIGHLGMYRDEDSLEPVWYYHKMPQDIDRDYVILADPMLATGGSLIAALDELYQSGGDDRKMNVATVIASPEGIEALRSKFKTIPIYTAAVDRQLNENGFILPGLGDAGDRQFGTGE